MALPRFLAELSNRERYPHHRLGALASAAVTLALAGAIALAQHFGLIAPGWSFHAVAAGKVLVALLVTLILATPRLVLPALVANVLTDLTVIAAALHVTGGMLSPLFALYVVHIAIVGLLANAGATLMTAGAAVLSYAALGIGTHLGLWPSHPPPVSGAGAAPAAYLVLGFAYACFAIGVPAVVTALFLRRLRDRRESLAQRTAELEEEARRRNQFTATLTHELRNPIHGICGLADLMKSEIYGPVTDKQKGALRQIRGSADGLLQLIDDHMQMAKDEAGRLELHLGDVALEELVPTVAASLDWMLQTKHVRLDVEVEPSLPALRTDRGKLNQILVNLMTNAVKYTPDGGRITVLARRRDDARVSISVKDTGEGIAEQELDRIFEAFHQVGGGAAGGVGLGLSLVKRLIHLLGGEIQVGSQLGRGTTFIVTLPVNAEIRREASDPAQRAIESRGSVVRKPRE